MKVTYYGHACFLIEFSGIRLLFDPFITPNPLAADIDVNAIEADYILLSHGHQDHVADAIYIAKRTGAQCISNFEIYQWLEKEGIENLLPINHGGAWNLPFGKVKFVNAVHSSVLPDGTYGGNPGGFVVESESGNFYYAGDTALTLDMQLIPKTSRPLDFVFLPIGDVFTMGIDDAILAADFVQCDTIIGMHYDTFDPIRIDHTEAVARFKSAGKELILMEIGDNRTMIK